MSPIKGKTGHLKPLDGQCKMYTLSKKKNPLPFKGMRWESYKTPYMGA